MFDWVAAYLVYAFYVFVFLLFLNGTFFIVRQQSRAIIERFGKYHRTASPGFRMKIPIIDKIVDIRWLRIEQLPLVIETKTKDNVFVKVHVAIQNRVLPDKAADSYYQLDDEAAQISAYVFDVVRAKVPMLDLDHVFEKKDDIAKEIKETLAEQMGVFGFEIVSALVTDIDPDAKVKAAMNEIQAQQRLQIAAAATGEAAKIITVKNAEAEAESKQLQGEGIAKQRLAIANGMKESVAALAEATGVDKAEIMQTMMLTQYLDTVRDIGVGAGSRVILLPHQPGGMADVAAQIRDAVIGASETGRQ